MTKNSKKAGPAYKGEPPKKKYERTHTHMHAHTQTQQKETQEREQKKDKALHDTTRDKCRRVAGLNPITSRPTRGAEISSQFLDVSLPAPSFCR